MYGYASPCKDCRSRKLGCHGTCEKYKQYRELIDKASDKARKERVIDSLFGRAFFKERTGWK